MQQRTYRASCFDEVIALVKSDLGQDAVILSSRELDNAQTGRREVELTALPPGAMAGSLGSQRDGVALVTRRLARTNLSPASAARLSRAIVRAHGGAPPSLSMARDALTNVLRREIGLAGPVRRTGARVVALVGPTGVGKTTTLAKIAGRAALVEQRRVALLSIDDYRIAGAEQLSRYADLIGIPMELAHDARSLEVALRRLADADLVLIDTAGRSPRDRDAIERTAETLGGAQEVVEAHLCIAAATGHAQLSRIIEQAHVLQPGRLIITKVDEAVHWGSMLDAHFEAQLPFSYLTTGQRVPEDIEPASIERLASLLIGEGLDS